MSEWKQVLLECLVAAADVGLTVLFYQMYKDKCSVAEQIQELQPLDWSTMKDVIAQQANGCIEYGMVEGFAHSIKEPLRSQFTDDKGAIKHFKRVLHKSERLHGSWSDRNTILSDNYDRVPFALYDSFGQHSMVVSDPKSATLMEEAMLTTYDKFEPNTRSFSEAIFDRLFGEVTKGYQTTEQILKNGTAMLGLGKIVFINGSLELRNPGAQGSPYILTSLTKSELIDHLKSRAVVYKIITGIFGVAGVMILWVTLGSRIRQWIDDYRARSAMEEVRTRLEQMKEAGAAGVADETFALPASDSNNLCVICLTNDRELANRPCGHVCTCLSCYEAMPRPKLCPVCRASVSEVIPIFIS